MRASMFLALSALSLPLFSTAAQADETAKPAAGGNVITVPVVKIMTRRPHPQVAVDVARLVPRVPLPELRKPLVPGAGVLGADPF